MQSQTPLVKRQNLLRRNRYVLLSFAMAAGTMLIVYLCTGVFPFGGNTMLRMDLYHQYGPLFAELYDRLFAHESLQYSWTSGLGSCFLGNYFNYLSSPIGAIVVFFGHKHVPEAIAAMALIKAALAAGTFTYYLKRSQNSHAPVSAAFGLLYAFCGYMLAYYWNVMWLDAMVLLPLILFGIEQIIDAQKPAWFVFSLSLSMFSNYYMSYMLCLFSVIYFLYYYFSHYAATAQTGTTGESRLKNSRFLRSGFLFVGAALLAAALMAAALLPTYRVLQNCSATSGGAPNEWKTYFTFFDFFANHLGGLTTTIRSSGDDVLPNVYCGVLTLLLAPLYFFTKSIEKKEKAATLLLLAVFFLSFNLNRLNFYWHGMHFPNDLPYRFSFMYSFILLVMGYKTFRRLREFSSRQIALTGVLLLAFVVIVQDIASKNVTDTTVYFTMAFLALYVFLLILLKSRKTFALSMTVMLCVCICSEAIICDTPDFPNNVTRASYEDDYDEFRALKEKLDTIEQDSFYRMELTNLRTRMDNSWFGYNGVSVFSSMAYEKMAKMESSLGMMSNKINSYTYNPQTPVYNMMHALKYVVNNEAPNTLSDTHYSFVTKEGKYNAYTVKDYLPLAFCVDAATEQWLPDRVIPFDEQTAFFHLATGLEGELFHPVPLMFINYTNCEPFTEDLSETQFYFRKTDASAEASATFSVTTTENANVYLYFAADGANSKDVNISSVIGSINQNASQNCILDLGYYKKGETINVTVPFERDSGYVTVSFCTMDNELFSKGYEKLSQNTMQLTELSGTSVRGNFTADEDCLLYTSIPYDTGWRVTLDGAAVDSDDLVAIGDALLGVRVAKGVHEISFRYHTPGLGAGILISGFALFVLIVILVVQFLLKRRTQKRRLRAGLPILLDTRYGGCADEALFLPTPEQPQTPEKPQSASRPSAPTREVIRPPKQQPKKEIIVPPEQTVEEIDLSSLQHREED